MGRVQLLDADTHEVLAESHNMVVNDGLNLTGLLLAGLASVGLTYCAIGTGTTAVADTQHALVTETARQQITQAGVTAAVMTLSTFFAAATCGVHIKELGLFGAAATSAANSGTMYARTLLDYDNSSSPRNLTIAWAVTHAHA